MAFTTFQQVKDLLPGPPIYDYIKTGMSNTNDMHYSLWTLGPAPAAGAAPSSGLAGDIPTSATTGAVPFTNPASGAWQLGRWTVTMPRNGAVFLYDRLWQDSGFTVTQTTAHTVNSVALTRPDAFGAGAELWWQVYATMGANNVVLTASYTNPAGTAGRTAVTPAGYMVNMQNLRTGQFQLDAGDTGIKSVQTLTIGTSFVSGTIGLVIRRKIAEMVFPLISSGYQAYDALSTLLATIPNSACLEFLVLGSGSSPQNIAGELNFVNG
jgi:hypothetical protein